MKIKFLHIEKSKIFYALVLLLISSITFVYAGSVWCSYYRQGTISAYSNWYQNQYCEWLDFKVTMDEITTGRRLLCTIEEKHYSTGDLVDTLWEGYLSQGYSSSTVQPNDSENNIWVKLTETDGYQTYFKIKIEGYQFQK
jgi:hypothetical protein